MKEYTCCIDLKTLEKTVERLNSINNCIYNSNVSNIFYDMENLLKKENFEHGNCFSSYNQQFDYIKDEIENIDKDLFQLNYALQKTIIITKQSDVKTVKDLQTLSEYYGDTPANNTGINASMNPKVIIANDRTAFERNMDPFVKALTEAPMTEEESLAYSLEDYNQLPIGISIALTGIASEAGTVMIHSIRKLKKEKEMNRLSIKERTFIETSIDKDVWEDTVPSYARKDLNEKRQFYPDNYDIINNDNQ